MNSTRIATKRTTWNAAALTIVVFVAEQLTERDIDVSNPILLLVVPAAVGVFYRTSRELSARFPALGRVLFGDATEPRYDA